MRRGAIILCGGRSTRMGRDKATLPFGPERMLQRVVRLVADEVPLEQIVVVAAVGQPLPELPTPVQLAHDERPERGPLEGLAAGLRALGGRVDAAYATACDVPLLAPRFVARLFADLQGHAIVVPREGTFYHPLAAVYRSDVLPAIERLLAADRLRVRDLYDDVDTREIAVELLREVDPQLASLANLNRPEDYRAALHRAGFDAPE